MEEAPRARRLGWAAPSSGPGVQKVGVGAARSCRRRGREERRRAR